ncbi:MAG: hypothetical protein U0Q15_02515 [Kineosporiaceae bacterium]
MRSAVVALVASAALTTVAVTTPVVAAHAADAPTLVRGVHVNGPARTFTPAAGQDLKVLFTAVPGQVLSFSVKGTYGDPCDVNASVLTPRGVERQAVACAGAGAVVAPVRVDASGLWAVAFDVAAGKEGSVTVGVTATGPATVTPNIGALSVTLPANGTRDLAFRLEKGEYAHFAAFKPLPGEDFAPAQGQVLRPDGTTLTANPNHVTTDQSGVHRLRITSYRSVPVTVAVDLVKGRDIVGGSIVPGGPPLMVTLPVRGQQARITFPATAGQRVVVESSDYVMSGGDDTNVGGDLVGPDGSVWGGMTLYPWGESTSLVRVTGTQTLVVDPSGEATGRLTIALRTVTDPARRTLALGTSLALPAPEPFTNPSIEFRGSKGQWVRFTVSSATMIDLRMHDPVIGLYPLGNVSGTSEFDSSPTRSWMLHLRSADPHKVVLNFFGPASAPSTVSLDAVPLSDISLGTPRTVRMDAEVVALRIDRDLTADQALSWNIAQSTVGAVTVELRNDNGASLEGSAEALADGGSGTFRPVFAAGPYTVLLHRHGPAGSLVLGLS